MEENEVLNENSDETIYDDLHEGNDDFQSNPETQHDNLFEGNENLVGNNLCFPPRKARDATLKEDGSLGRSKSLFPPRKARYATLKEDGSLGRSKSLFPPRKARDATLKEDGNLGRSKSLFPPRKARDATLNMAGALDSNNEGKGRVVVSGIWKKLPLKVKLIIIGIAVGLVFVVMFLIILITPLMSLGIIDIEGIGSSVVAPSYNYSSVSANTTYYWPIGSSETTISNGVTFASGTPAVTTITSNYSAQEDFRNDAHNGIDIGNDGNGAGIINVIAVEDGTVVYPSSASQTSYSDNGYYGNTDGYGFGNYVMISHSDGTTTVYAHLAKDSITVFNGDKVSQGQVIGKMGNSGSSTGTHLHFEVRVNGDRKDPNGYVSANNPRPKSTGVNYISGDSNKQSVCLTLKTTGFSDNAIAAIMTNIKKESSFNPTALGDNGTSYGLCQWHNGRYDNLRTLYPDSYHTIGSQIDYLMYELENKYVSVYKSLSDDTNSASDLTYTFCAKFEKPANTENSCRKRSEMVEEYYNYVINGCK